MEIPKLVPENTNYYFYDDATRIIYYSKNFPEDSHKYIYLGISDNKRPFMAAAVFAKNNLLKEGYKISKFL